MSSSVVESIKPLIGVVENTRRELSWGVSLSKRTRGEKLSHAPTTPAVNLGQIILASMKHVEATLLFVFEHKPKPFEKEKTSQLLDRLDHARDAAREEFASLFQGMNEENDDVEVVVGTSEQFLFLVSLIEVGLYLPIITANGNKAVVQMANEMHRALLVAGRILDLHKTSRTRLWYPRLSWAWLGIAPPTIISDDRDRVMSDDNHPERFENENRLSMAEAREGLSELVRWRESNLSAPITPSHGSKFASKESLRLRNVMYGPRITQLRLLLATCVRAVSHSSHLQHAVKNSIGVMLLSLPAFLPTGGVSIFPYVFTPSSMFEGQRWFAQTHGQWMIISYVWVLETNTGATWRVAYLRIVRINPMGRIVTDMLCLGWYNIGGCVRIHRE